ncbi:hypothetical protein YC2023_060294 [Brassica napus]
MAKSTAKTLQEIFRNSSKHPTEITRTEISNHHSSHSLTSPHRLPHIATQTPSHRHIHSLTSPHSFTSPRTVPYIATRNHIDALTSSHRPTVRHIARQAHIASNGSPHCLTQFLTSPDRLTSAHTAPHIARQTHITYQLTSPHRARLIARQCITSPDMLTSPHTTPHIARHVHIAIQARIASHRSSPRQTGSHCLTWLLTLPHKLTSPRREDKERYPQKDKLKSRRDKERLPTLETYISTSEAKKRQDALESDQFMPPSEI